MNLFVNIYFTFRYLLDCIIDYIFSLFYNSNRRYLPKPQNSLVLQSATSLARKIQLKEVTAEEVVKAFIERIKEINGVLNAVVDDRFEEALKEARQVDLDINSGKITAEDFIKKPFLGVPFTSKESTLCKGLKCSFGLISRKNEVSKEDAIVVQLMKEAGGILLGVTNVPQLNLWQESYNTVYGITNNPYNTTKNVGGSSGGEACIIAARGSPIGIGTDIGGSLRIPSHRCGIFGHKCTPELISTHGLTFREGDIGPTIVTAGPMSAHSEDLIPLLKVLLNDNINRLRLNEDIDIKKINIYYTTSSHCLRASPIHKSMKQLILKCVEHFNSISATKPQEVNFKNIKYGLSLWLYMITQEKSQFLLEIMNKKEQAKPLVELFKYICMLSDFNFYTVMNIINLKLPKPTRDWAEPMLKSLKTEIMDKLGNNGVLLFPSEPYAAGYHYTSVLRPFNFSYYCVWNALKFPVTQVPLGLNKDGMPVGVQVVAAPLQDSLCIAVAQELERTFGGYVPPFNAGV